MPADLEALARLDDDLLYLFVAGPGTGEGIVVALPQRAGWVAVDGAAHGGDSIPARVMRRFGAARDALLAFVLTHPHEDHVGGVPQLLEEFPPGQVWVTASRPAGPHLLDLCEAMVTSLRAKATFEEIRLRGVQAAIVALARWTDAADHAIRCAVDGEQIDLGPSAPRLRVRAPCAGPSLDRILEELASGRRHRANEASIVLELTFGATSIVLGGDLPRVRTRSGSSSSRRATSIPTGWDAVMRKHPHLADHTALKLAHHASEAAWHDLLMAAPPSERAWVVTPFTKLPDPLPRANLLQALVTRQSPLCVTHPPEAWQLPSGWQIPASQVRSRAAADPTGDPFADAAEDIRTPPPQNALDPIWVFAFDDRGELQGTWRGATAIAIT